jgi:phage tail protein X
MAVILYSRQGDTVDALAWRELGLGSADIGPLFEANRGLADLGPILPERTAVAVPASAPAAETLDIIQLWD